MTDEPTPETFRLRVTIVNANGQFAPSYYANPLKEYARFRGLSGWQWAADIGSDDEPGPLRRATRAVTDIIQERGYEMSDYPLDGIEHKMHLTIGWADVDRDGNVQAVYALDPSEAHPASFNHPEGDEF